MDDELELLWAELRECNSGYSARDSLVQQSFARVSTAFAGFMALLLTFNALVQASEGPRVTLVSFIFAAGLLAMVGLATDMASTAGARTRLRNRARVFRARIRKSKAAQELADVYKEYDEAKRPRFIIEMLVDPLVRLLSRTRDEAEIRVYSVATYAMVLLWVAAFLVVLLSGGEIDLRGL